MELVLLILCGLALAAIVWRFVYCYQNCEGSPWDRLLAVGHNSATILWQLIVATGGIAVSGAALLAELAGLPEVRDAIKEYLPPEYVGLALVTIAVIGTFSRMRTLGRD